MRGDRSWALYLDVYRYVYALLLECITYAAHMSIMMIKDRLDIRLLYIQPGILVPVVQKGFSKKQGVTHHLPVSHLDV
jgi:hypothetical protein